MEFVIRYSVMGISDKGIMPTIGNQQIKLLERLCNAVAVSGDEGEVRRIVLEEIKGHADEVKVDALGNVLACTGTGTRQARRGCA